MVQWLLSLLSLLFGVSAITLTVVVPSNIDCNKNVSSPFFVAYCDVSAPVVDVVSIVDGVWRETGVNSNWEYAGSGQCQFSCGTTADFSACQTSAGSRNIVNFYPNTSQCCVLNCTATSARINSTRVATTGVVRKAFRLPSSGIAVNSSIECSLVTSANPSLELLYQCAFPDSVARVDLRLRNAARTYNVSLSNMTADRWFYSNLVAYDQPYLFQFPQPINDTGCVNTDAVLKDSSYSQRVCTGNLSMNVMFGKQPHYARGLWLGSTSNVSLASNIQLIFKAVLDPNSTGTTGTITVPNNATYVSFGAPVTNLLAVTLVPSVAAGRIEISELALDIFSGSCPIMNAPAYGTMFCTLAPPETLDVSCNFGCNAGFSLSGSSSTQCRETSTVPAWISGAPSCNAVSCPAMTEALRPRNGNFSCTNGSFGMYYYTSVCTFTCNPGFNLSHTLSRTCTSAGTWDNTIPTCVNINDCTPSSCPTGSTCFDGVQRTYCGLTVVPNSTAVVSGASVQPTGIQLDTVQGGSVLSFNITLNDVTQADVRTFSFGNSLYPTAYAANCTVAPLGLTTCTLPPGVGRHLNFQVSYEVRISSGEDEIVASGTFRDNSSEFAYPIPRFVNKTLQFYGDASSYSGNPLVGRTTLGEVIQFAGVNFITPRSPQLVVYYGNPAESRNYTCVADSSCPQSSSYLCCKTQSNGQGTYLAFTVVILGELQVYTPDTYSYPVPARVTKVTGCTPQGAMTINCPTTGTTITVQGVGFTSTSTITVKPPAVNPIFYNSTYLTFDLAPGVGVNLPLVVKFAELDSDGVTPWISYGAPNVTNLTGVGCYTPQNETNLRGCPKSGTFLTFTGSNFGYPIVPIQVLIGVQACTNVTYIVNHSQFSCFMGPGYLADQAITLIQTGGVFQQASQLVSYFACQPGNYSNTTDGLCYSCPRNQYTPIAGLSSCTECDAGQFSNGGNYTCSPCPPGTASKVGQDCTPCAAGTYAPVEGQQIACVACPVGRFSNTSNATDCTRCFAGSAQALPNSTSCDLCEYGKHQVSREGAACDRCDPGFFANLTGLADCLRCDPGTFAEASGLESCEQCPAGKAAALPQSKSCTSCLPGQMASSMIAATACLDCESGTYQDRAEQVDCISCDAGSSSFGTRQVTCSLCPSGRFAPTVKSSACDECAAGTYAIGPGNITCAGCGIGTSSSRPAPSACVDCRPGSFAAAANSSTCTSCDSGRFQGAPRASGCKDCVPGSYYAYTGATACLPCGTGSYSSSATGCDACLPGRFALANSPSCTSCPRGKAAFGSSQGSCVDCPSGKYSGQVNASECTDCEPGRVQELPSQSSCHECAPGSSAVLVTSCSTCPAGKYSNFSTASQCAVCLPGSFSNQNGLSSCDLCLPGTYLDSYGRTRCETCPIGTFSLGSAATRCEFCDPPKILNGALCVCPLGQYLSDDGSCPACPKGASCQAAGLVGRTLKAAAGYWRSPNLYYPTFYKCLTLSHCPEQPYSFDPLGRDDLNYSAIVCGFQRHGPICALCKDGFKSASVVSVCADCANNTAGTALSILIIIGMVIALGITYFFLLRADRRLLLAQQEAVKQQSSAHLSRSSLSVVPVDPKPKTEFDFDDDEFEVPALHSRRKGAGKEMGQIKIVIGFFQIVYNLTSIRNLSWPAGFKMVASAFSFINLDFIPWNSIGCAVPFNFYVRIAVVALSPLVIMAFVFFAYFLPSFWKDTRDFSDHDLARVIRGQKRNQLKKMFLFALFLMYPFISREVLSFFLCESVDGVEYLVPDFNLHCYDELWRSWLGPVIVMILVYPIGCPLTVLFLLFRHAKRGLLDTDSVRISYGFLFESYRNPCWWFEFADMLHKIFLTSVLNFFPDVAQLPVALVVVGVYTILLLLATPYIETADDEFHMLAQTEIFNIIMCAWVLQGSGLETGSVEEVLLSILLCALLFTLLLDILRRLILKLRPHYQKVRKSVGAKSPQGQFSSNLAAIEAKIEKNAYNLSIDEE